jgi:hypothetical protein
VIMESASGGDLTSTLELTAHAVGGASMGLAAVLFRRPHRLSGPA